MFTAQKFRVFLILKQYILKQYKDYREIFECITFNLTEVPDVNKA